MSNNEEFEKLELHFELTYINNRNVKDIAHQWQQIYDRVPHEAFWTLIQMFLDSTGYLGIRVDQSSENFTLKNMNAILNRIPTKNYATEKSIMYSSKLRENFSLLIRDIILANWEIENFFETYIKTIIVFLFQLTTKKGEIFHATGSIMLMKVMYILLEVGRNYPGHGINNLIKKYAPQVLGHLANSFEYQDCVQIMYRLFINAFAIMEYSSFEITYLKKVFLKILTIADSNITCKILLFIRHHMLEKDQPVTDKLYKLKLFGSKEIMFVLLHLSVGTNKRIAVTAFEIINNILNNSGKSSLTQHDYTPLFFRMYDSNMALRKLAGITFQILHYESQGIIENMIKFYLQYPKYHENISYLVDACFMPSQLDRLINELIEILCRHEMPDEYKIVGGQILLQLFKNILRLREYKEVSSNLFERLPELFLVSQHIRHVTLNLLEVVVSDTIDADANIIRPIVKHLIELVTTHKDYDILGAANTALYKLSKQRENFFKEELIAVMQSIYNAYNLSRITIHEEPDTYKICLIRFRAASEFTEFVSEYFGEKSHDILDTLFNDLKSQDTNDTIREHQIVLYTTLVSAEYKRQLDVALFERTVPFLLHIVTMLADFADDSEPNTLLTHAVIPGICIFYIMASRPIDLATNTDRIRDIPPHIYSSIANVLIKMSWILSKTENNMSIMKTLLTYWVNLHKVQKIPNIPRANTILILYGNVDQLSDLLEDLMMSLHDYTTDRILLIASIGQSFISLGMVDKVKAKNYTNSLYKFLVRITVKNKEVDLLALLNSILIYILSIMEIKLKTNNQEKKNRLLPFNYLNNYIKRLAGNRPNDQIIEIINRILQFETITQGETNTLNNIKRQLEK